MKPRYLITLLLVVAVLNGFSQTASKLLKDVNEVKVRNIGVIYNKNQVKGYFTFYDYDKADKKNTVYKLNLLDENLNDLGTTEIQGSKDLELQSSAFDGTNFCFKFWNADTKNYELRVYDQEGKEVLTDFLKNGKNGKMGTNMAFNMVGSKEINTTEDNGFILYNYNGDNSSFYISYIDGIKKRMWNTVYETDRKYKGLIPTKFLGANKEMVLTAVLSLDKGMYTFTSHNYLIANDITDGKLLFDISTDFEDVILFP
jgi:hypothetical protein